MVGLVLVDLVLGAVFGLLLMGSAWVGANLAAWVSRYRSYRRSYPLANRGSVWRRVR